MPTPRLVDRIDLPSLATGTTTWFELALPGVPPQTARGPLVAAVRGSADGPTVYVGSGMHGDELNSIEAVRRLAVSLDPARVRGTVFFVVAQNQSAVLAGTRLSPADAKNLDHCFPGDPGGTPSQVLAHVLFEQLVSRCDAVLDLHCASQGGWNLLYSIVHAEDEATLAASAALAHAFGCALVLPVRKQPGRPLGDEFGSALDGNLFVRAALGGRPAAIVEFGGAGSIDEAQVSLGVAGVLNVLRHLDVLDGRQPRQEGESARTAVALRCTTSGLLRLFAPSGSRVEAGQLVGVVQGLAGAAEAITAPHAGTIVRMTTSGSVSAGDRIVTMASR
ncbi:succinylglutamate desuccinylase/aspartoacylase family protein [Phytohabitans sp. ZYX-F-186]|uniref:Succinylglutamate desuccinylase/aspartoacylase family protein n=1 Tax=Phytohabitans maris TaxID=3071409 RepID=A0ABU0ZSF6_9ACTN|nr:succinylglutamate desuccinylase/aspartoacylase family protein [Phytohabitans sp. ZYX-F-186]MDQ7909910.1 succinylglutamate desuccinylase/aspartoacylase family protein [Phytohabitans sp. ZYX-F-186]